MNQVFNATKLGDQGGQKKGRSRNTIKENLSVSENRKPLHLMLPRHEQPHNPRASTQIFDPSPPNQKSGFTARASTQIFDPSLANQKSGFVIVKENIEPPHTNTFPPMKPVKKIQLGDEMYSHSSKSQKVYHSSKACQSHSHNKTIINPKNHN